MICLVYVKLRDTIYLAQKDMRVCFSLPGGIAFFLHPHFGQVWLSKEELNKCSFAL